MPIELRARTLKRADEGQVEDSPGCAGVVVAPLPRCGVVEAKTHSVDWASWAVATKLVDMTSTVPNLASHQLSIELVPLVLVSKDFLQPPVANLPLANQKVKLILTVLF